MSRQVRAGVLVALGFVGGWIAAQVGPWRAYAQNAAQVDRYTYNNLTAWVLPVRHADEQEVTKDTKRVGVEVFRDNYHGNIIYLTEAGAIAAVPEHVATSSPDAPASKSTESKPTTKKSTSK